MRALAAVCLAALIISGCRCGRPAETERLKPPADAGVVTPRPLSAPARAFREGDTAYQQGKPDEAIARAQDVVKAEPKNALAHNLIGRSFAAKYETSKAKEDADQARRAFREAINADPRFWPAMINLAELELKVGDTKAAAGLYARVLELEPNHPQRAQFEKVIAEAK